MVIAHPQLVCSHVSDKQMTWKPIYNRYNLGLLTSRTLHGILSLMSTFVSVLPKVLLLLNCTRLNSLKTLVNGFSQHAPALCVKVLPY